MKRALGIPAAIALCLAASAPAAGAGTNPTELTVGLLGVGYTGCDGCQSVLEVATGGATSGVFSGRGGGGLAAGFYLSPRAAVEPMFSLSHVGSGISDVTVLGIGLAVPLYSRADWGHRGSYLAPRLGYNAYDLGSGSVRQFTVGVAFGAKSAINEFASFRAQVSFDYGFEGDLKATRTLGLQLGLSLFVE